MKICVFHASAGHGHQRVAEVITQAFFHHGLTPDDVMVEDALDSTPDWFHRIYPGFYYFSVKKTPAAWGWGYERLDRESYYRWVRPLRRFVNQWVGGKLLERMIQTNPETIICTHFLTAEVFARAKMQGRLKSRLITVVTDYYPHTFWVNEGTDLYWVMAQETAEDLKRRGVPERAVRVGGIPTDRRFLPSGNRREILEKWNLSPDRFTLLLSSGSFGLGPQIEILKSLEPFRDRVQCFVVCGNNRVLEDELRARTFPYPVQIFGFVDFMPDLMEAADLLIAKPGGSTTTESLVKGLPMVVMEPIPGQETRNARLLRQRNAAFFMKDPSQIKVILHAVFDYPDIMKEKKANIAALACPKAADELVACILKNETSQPLR